MRSLMQGYFRWFEILNHIFIDNEIILKVNTPHLRAVQGFGGAGPAANFSPETCLLRKEFPHREKMWGRPLLFQFRVIITDK